MSFQKKRIITITVLLLLFSTIPAMGETIEEFLIKCTKGHISSQMIHNDSRSMLIMGNQVITLDKDKFLEVLRITKKMTSNTEILEFQILNQFQSEKIISVVTKIKSKITIGKSVTIGEQISHDILMKKGNSFVLVFSIAIQ